MILKYSREIESHYPEKARKIIESVERFQNAIEEGLIHIVQINYMKYSKDMDKIRKYLSKLDAKHEHSVKKADPELIILVLQIYEKTKEVVFFASKDKNLMKVLEILAKGKYKVIEYEDLIGK